MVPKDVTLAVMEVELPGAEAWAARRSLVLEWNPEALTLRSELTQPKTLEVFYLKGTFDEYKALPPKWEFCDPEWRGSAEKSLYPRTVPNSIFHGNGILCAPFNRLAYKRFGGPHSDWGDATQWMTTAPGRIQARTVGDMLQAIYRDFPATRGRMK